MLFKININDKIIISTGFFQHYGRENIVCNNIFTFVREAMVSCERTEKHNGLLIQHIHSLILLLNENLIWIINQNKVYGFKQVNKSKLKNKKIEKVHFSVEKVKQNLQNNDMILIKK